MKYEDEITPKQHFLNKTWTIFSLSPTISWLPMATADVNNICPLTVIQSQTDVIVTKLLVIWKVKSAVCQWGIRHKSCRHEIAGIQGDWRTDDRILGRNMCHQRNGGICMCGLCSNLMAVRHYRELRRISTWNGSENLTYFLLLRFERTDRTLTLLSACCIHHYMRLSVEFSFPARPPCHFFLLFHVSAWHSHALRRTWIKKNLWTIARGIPRPRVTKCNYIISWISWHTLYLGVTRLSIDR